MANALAHEMLWLNVVGGIERGPDYTIKSEHQHFTEPASVSSESCESIIDALQLNQR